MSRDIFDRTPEQQYVILIDAATLCKAERQISSWEHCNPDDCSREVTGGFSWRIVGIPESSIPLVFIHLS